MRVLSLCDRTGVMVKPWLDAGFDATIVDLQHEGVTIEESIGRGTLTRVSADVTKLLPDLDDYAIVFAFPPCTHLAVSGARWFKSKGMTAVIDALRVVESCRRIAEWSRAPYMIENPVSTLSTYWRDPDYRFDPYEYGGYLEGGGDAYRKRTCLWTGGGFVMPEPKPVDPVEGSKMHFMAPGPERANLRSVTPAGFAQAVYEANVLLPLWSVGGGTR